MHTHFLLLYYNNNNNEATWNGEKDVLNFNETSNKNNFNKTKQ